MIYESVKKANDERAYDSYDKCDVLIPWSGGFDSTALVLKALSEGKRVAWCAYDLVNNRDQCSAETQARLKMVAHLNHNNIRIEGEITDIFDVRATPNTNRYLLPRLIVSSTVLGKDANEIWLGYTRDDTRCEDWKFEDHAAMVPAIQSLWSITRTSKCPTVRFPFLDVEKVKMLEYYKKHRPMLDMIATCQTGYNSVLYYNCDKCHKLSNLKHIFNQSL